MLVVCVGCNVDVFSETVILPSSARVSGLTCQTAIGVRYPELVRPTSHGWQYGRYVSTEATPQRGFLPVLWDVPRSKMHAVSDVAAMVEWLQDHISYLHPGCVPSPLGGGDEGPVDEYNRDEAT